MPGCEVSFMKKVSASLYCTMLSRQLRFFFNTWHQFLMTQGGLKSAAKDNNRGISLQREKWAWCQGYSQDPGRCADLWELFFFAKTNEHTLYWCFKPSYWPNARQSPLMGSIQHATSSCKPNQCCPFLHSLDPLVIMLKCKFGLNSIWHACTWQTAVRNLCSVYWRNRAQVSC